MNPLPNLLIHLLILSFYPYSHSIILILFFQVLQAKNSELEHTIETLRIQAKKDNDEILSLRKQLQDLTKSQQSSSSELTTAMAAKTAKIAEWEKKYGDLELALEKTKKELLEQTKKWQEEKTRLQDEILRLKKQISELEKQHGSDQDIIVDLRKQLDLLNKRKITLEEQVKSDHDTIVKLRAQLEELLKRQVVSEEADMKRIKDLQEVNDTLLMFARERAFQEDLQRPLVKVLSSLSPLSLSNK